MTKIKTRYIALLVAAAALLVGSLDAPAADAITTSSIEKRDAKLEKTFRSLGLLSATEANCRVKLTPEATVLANYAYNTDFELYSEGSVRFYELAKKYGRKDLCTIIVGMFSDSFEQ